MELKGWQRVFGGFYYDMFSVFRLYFESLVLNNKISLVSCIYLYLYGMSELCKNK